MLKKLTTSLALLLLTACVSKNTTSPPTDNDSLATYSLHQVQAIPKPSEMKADVIINGRVSTINHIDVAYVGKQIPFTYSDGKVFNSDNFEWYVSKHFALRTDYPAEKAQYFLELLELSYPHYVEYFSMEPPNIENQRIASTYATSNNVLRNVMFDDGFNRGINHTAGGEAMYYNLVGYSFPTERPQHRRYISIHETMHSYQMALGNYPWTPSWYGEGQGDSLALHVFDSKKKRLTLYGHDSPIFDALTSGVGLYKVEQPTIVDIHNRSPFHRGLNVLFVQFMHNNPEYSQYLKIYHQEIMRQQTASKKTSLQVLQASVPDWQALEAAFKTWVENIQESHEIAARGPWEIDGNMFYKRPSNFNYKPQRLGLRFVPGAKPAYRWLMLDYPAPDPSDLLLPIKRGVTEPTIGYQLDYITDSISDGSLGMALAVKSTPENAQAKAKSYVSWRDVNTDLDEQFRVEIKSASILIIDDRTLQGALTETPLPQTLVNAIKTQAEPKLGVSIKLVNQAVEVTVKTANNESFVHTHPVSKERFEQLLNREIGLVSTNNNHGITPYIDDGRDLNPNIPNYNEQAPANVWRFEGDALSLRFARALWRVGKEAPSIWRESFARLNQAALNPRTANKELAAIESNLVEIAKAGEKYNDGLAELSGVQLQVDWLGSSAKTLKEYAIITNTSKSAISGKIKFTVNGKTSETYEVNVAPGQRTELLIPEQLLANGEMVLANFSYQWLGFSIEQNVSQKTVKYKGLTLALPEATYKDGQLTITANLNGPFNGATKGIVTFDLYHGKEKESFQEAVEVKPYESKKLQHSYKVDEKELDHSAWLEVTIVVDSDGEPVTLRKRRAYTPTKFNR